MAELTLEANDLDTEGSVAKQSKASEPTPAPKVEETPPAPKPGDTPPPPAPKVEETPPAPKPGDTPPPPKVEETPPAAFDEGKFSDTLLEEIFGAKVDKNTAKQLASQLPQLKAYAEKLAALEKNQVNFANDYVKGLNDYLSKGGNREIYDKIQALDLVNLNGLDALKALYKWEHPELTEEQIAKKLDKKYSQSKDFDEDEKELGLVDITIDSKDAKKKLEAIKQKESVPDAERSRLEQEEAEVQRVAAWKPEVQKIIEAVSGIDVVLESDDKGNPTDTFQYKVSDPKLKQALAEDVNNILTAWDVKPTAETVKDVAAVVQERLWLRERANIVQAVWSEANTRIDKHYREKYHIGDPPPNGDKLPVNTTKATNEDELADRQIEYSQGRRK